MLLHVYQATRGLTSNRRLLAAHLSTAVLIAGVICRTDILGWGLHGLGAAAAAVTIIALFVVPTLTARGMWSASFMYLLMLALFHLSIPVVLALGVELPRKFAAYTVTWYTSGHVPEAIYLSGMAVVALTTAATWAAFNKKEPALPAAPVVAPKRFAEVGSALVVAGVVLYLGSIAVAAPELLTGGSYSDYLDTVGGMTLIPVASLMIAVGLCLAVVSGKCRARTVACVAFIVFTVITLAFGNRTAGMFPAVAAAVAAAATASRTPRARTAVMVVAVGLMAITAVQQVRETGVSADALSEVTLNPVSSLGETGGTLRTVAEVVMWRRTYREGQFNGSTYANSLVRQWERAIGKPRPAGPDTRYAGELLLKRYPPLQLGFSPVAEAFLNFGTTGVIVIFLVLGFALGIFDSRRLGYVGAARLGIVMYALAYSVRNASNAMPATLAVGLAVIWFASRTPKATSSPQETRPVAQRPAAADTVQFEAIPHLTLPRSGWTLPGGDR